ncbi:hypothetical protein CDAR_20081 [Caerostris darwini]|uniref:Uncharacterized protein n=1 Tax=Caerostris darwini TaxID=1538125 RepID=A0AAV4PW56_9ARAC|nr:hypothetical protein CDAR_20081 [Caerostris darwini]
MEETLNISPVLHKLEYLSLIRIALNLQANAEFRRAFDFRADYGEDDGRINDIALPSDKALSSMNIPQLLKKELLVHVRYLALEFREWLILHCLYLKDYALDQFPNICWKWDGRIDRQQKPS